MTKFYTLAFVGILSLIGIISTAHATGSSSALGKPYIQKALKYRVDYKIDPKFLTLHIVAEPALTACGSVTDVPLKASFDNEAADIIVGDYMFLKPTGTNTRNCGNPYKAASAKLSIDRGSIARKNIKILRLWYNHTLDTFRLEQDRYGGLSLQGPFSSKMFYLGRDLARLENRRPKP